MEYSLKTNSIGLKSRGSRMEEIINTKQSLIDEAKRSLSAQEFADEILRLREAAGLSQKELAAIIKIDKAVISRVENANHGVSLDLVMLLAIAFGEDPHRLADVYWGTHSENYDEQSRFTLSQIRDIIAKFYNLPIATIHEPPKHTPIPTTPAMEAELAEADKVGNIEAEKNKKENIFLEDNTTEAED